MFTYPILDSKIEIVGALGYDKGADGWVTPRRLPDWTRIQFADAGIERFLKFPSGVRLRPLIRELISTTQILTRRLLSQI